MFSDGMWIFYLESALALGMFVFIVWWTLPKKPRGQEPVSEKKNTTGRSLDTPATPSVGPSENAGNVGTPSDAGNSRSVSETQKPPH